LIPLVSDVVLVSDRFLETLAREGLSGWQAVPIPGLPDLGGPYSLLVITGRGGPAYGSDGIRFPGLPALGQFLDPEQWDGSDLFVVDRQVAIYITNAAAQRLARHRLTNLELEPIVMERLPLRPPSGA
jgi:hypothetical protein